MTAVCVGPASMGSFSVPKQAAPITDYSLSDVTYRLTLGALGLAADLCSLRRPIILCLHSVVAAGSGDFASELSITDRFLDRLLFSLRRRNIPVLSLSDALGRLQADELSPFVCFTFDDGYRDVYENAFPVFKRHDAPFTVFVTTGLIDGHVPMWWHVLERAIATKDKISWAGGQADLSTPKQKRGVFDLLRRRFREAELEEGRAFLDELAAFNRDFLIAEAYGQAMTWDMVREMMADFRVEIGCHTVTHPLLSRLGMGRLNDEIRGSHEKVKDQTGAACRFFAYPFGQLEEIGIYAPKIVQDAGFLAAFTTEACVMTPKTAGSAFLLPRVLLSRKAQSAALVRGYMSGIPQFLRPIRHSLSDRRKSA